ncbi:glycosyl transferase [Methylophaga thalassica]|uniref:Glycosyl transferase n=1 Tax=Methylophaga thalassica TaxID=40223 RepID=A0ABQ5TRR0_9GAMM|nr:glycosyltransferase [Methylophaga thalassica]GLP98284.1 glycosyl transferase [Methylophaga thalassica]
MSLTKINAMTVNESVLKVLVLLAAFNGDEWIEEQIHTILNQKNVELDVLISVDQSTDETYQTCTRLAKVYSNIQLLPYGERFGGAAANFFRLIREANFEKYDYIALADQDDSWLSDKLSDSIKVINQQGVDAFSSNVTAFWPSGKQVLVKKSFRQKQFDYFFEAAGPGCTYVLKTAVMNDFKTFMRRHEAIFKRLQLHDWTLYAFVRSHGYAWHIDEAPTMMYRQHASNQVGFNYGVKAILSRLRMIRDDWYAEQIQLYFLLFGKNVPNFKTNRLFLLKHFFQLRRRPRDACFLLVMLLFGLLKLEK